MTLPGKTREPFDYSLGFCLWRDDPLVRRHSQLEGYTFSLLENSSDSYRFHGTIGAGKVTDLFRTFARSLGEEAFFILEFYEDGVGVNRPADEEKRPLPTVFYSPYMPVAEIFATIGPYLPRLIHDGFVGFGLANNRAGMELFYSEEKVLTCFTGNHIRIMDLFSRFGLGHAPQLSLPTDFGHDHLSLLWHPQENLPGELAGLSEKDLDYTHFCRELTEALDMYPVEESLSFFLSKRDQDLIERCLSSHPDYEEFAEEDFGSLLFDWNDFVLECEAGFYGDLWEYRQGLNLRDMIQYVIDNCPESLGRKILDIIGDPDDRFQKILIDRRQRIDDPLAACSGEEQFWYRGIIRNQGADLRRDLIRHGWFK